MKYVNNKYTALIIAITIISLLWAAHFFSFFNLLNGYSYDFLMHRYPSTAASEKMIAIEVDTKYSEKGDEVWIKLLKELLASDAEAIAFTFFPDNVSRHFYRLAATSDKTIFGVHVDKTSALEQDNELVIPGVAHHFKVLYGLISPPSSQHGVIRKQHSIVQANQVSFPSFEKRVDQIVNGSETVQNSDYRVNFIGNNHRIPKIKIERILKGGLINELVSGRTVLIGANLHDSFSQYYTPVSSLSKMTSEVMFHAFALDTLLSERQIDDLPNWIFLLVLFFATVASLFIGQCFGFRISLYVSLAMSLVYLVLSWFLLGYFFIWVALVEVLLAQWLSFILVWAYRVNQEQKSLEQMLFGFPINSREKANTGSIYNSDEPWELLISIINQSLNLNRLIFLERIPGDHRLIEIKSMNCSMDDILEKRRDYQRVPYSIAINENRPVLLERNYLKESLEIENQYMAPLIFAGDVLGFWVFTIEPGQIKSTAKFNALTYSFMVQVSEILHYRHEWKKRVGGEQNQVWNYLRIAGNEHIQQLNKSTTLQDKKIFELQGVFNSINTSCVLYDLFGRIVMANKDMEALSQQADFRLFNKSLLEFITDLTDFDESGARNMIQRVMFDHEPLSIPVTHKSIKRFFMLHLLPLRFDETVKLEHIPDESQVFQINGVLCELVDVTGLKRLYHLKEQMFERFCFQVRNDLGSIMNSLAAEEILNSNAQNQSSVMQNIRGKTNQMIEMLDQVTEQMNVDVEQMLTNDQICYPVNGKNALLTAISNIQEVIDQREIKLNLDISELISLVYASPMELEVVLQAVLLTMIEDTYEADEITIRVEQDNQRLTYRIDNNGIGLSSAKPSKQKSNNSHDSDLLNLNYAMNCVHRWGGKFNIFSEMGEGSKAEIVLRCFL